MLVNGWTDSILGLQREFVGPEANTDYGTLISIAK